MKEYAIERVQKRVSRENNKHVGISSVRFRNRTLGWRTLLEKMVKERERGVPLQYLLGTEYFGELELEVRRGVLIPRCVPRAKKDKKDITSLILF